MPARRFSLFLALRYLKPKRTFLSIITLISILGVTLGVMVLILVISVMTGFERELTRKVVGFDAHLVVSNSGVMEDWPDVMKIGLGKQGGHRRRSVRPGTRPGRVSGPADGSKDPRH